MKRFYSALTNGFYLDAVHKTVPYDAVEISEDLYLSLLGNEIESDEDGMPRVKKIPPSTFEQRQGELLRAIDTLLNNTARSLGYDDIRTAVTYADEPAVPKFQAEGQALRAWRSNVYAKCYEVLGEVQAGATEEPDEVALLSMLPAFTLPGQEPV